MNVIRKIARECHKSFEENEIVRDWRAYEKLAEKEQHDVLDASLHRQHPLRILGRSMISMLYQAQPTSTADADCDQLVDKNQRYGGSWCSRGGRGAFFMLARKFDRYIEQLKSGDTDTEDTLGDARRYLILVESWHEARDYLPSENESKEMIGQTIWQTRGESICDNPECRHHLHTHEDGKKCLSVNCECQLFVKRERLVPRLDVNDCT